MQAALNVGNRDVTATIVHHHMAKFGSLSDSIEQEKVRLWAMAVEAGSLLYV